MCVCLQCAAGRGKQGIPIAEVGSTRATLNSAYYHASRMAFSAGVCLDLCISVFRRQGNVPCIPLDF